MSRTDNRRPCTELKPWLPRCQWEDHAVITNRFQKKSWNDQHIPGRNRKGKITGGRSLNTACFYMWGQIFYERLNFAFNKPDLMGRDWHPPLFHLLYCPSIAWASLNQRRVPHHPWVSKKISIAITELKNYSLKNLRWNIEKILPGYRWKMPHACVSQVSRANHPKTNKNTGPHWLHPSVHISYSFRISTRLTHVESRRTR